MTRAWSVSKHPVRFFFFPLVDDVIIRGGPGCGPSAAVRCNGISINPETAGCPSHSFLLSPCTRSKAALQAILCRCFPVESTDKGHRSLYLAACRKEKRSTCTPDPTILTAASGGLLQAVGERIGLQPEAHSTLSLYNAANGELVSHPTAFHNAATVEVRVPPDGCREESLVPATLPPSNVAAAPNAVAQHGSPGKDLPKPDSSWVALPAVGSAGHPGSSLLFTIQLSLQIEDAPFTMTREPPLTRVVNARGVETLALTLHPVSGMGGRDPG